jgi:hypothetical protein
MALPGVIPAVVVWVVAFRVVCIRLIMLARHEKEADVYQ